jgi:septum formation protein
MMGRALQAELPELVLASASAARRGLLRAVGLRFAVMPAAVDEDMVKRTMQTDGATPDMAALALAGAKARSIDRPGAVVIGEHLLRLRGQTHMLVTAVSCWRDGKLLFQDVSRPELSMRAFSTAFLEMYLEREGEACRDCVGGYRFEGLGMHLFDQVNGEMSAILGLPMLSLLAFLRRHGVLLA